MLHTEELEKYYEARAGEYDSTAGYASRKNAAIAAQIRARYQIALDGHEVLELACGPGYWTEAVAVTARSVLATDRDPTLVSMVRRRLAAAGNVRCEVSDAYLLEGVSGTFTAAFANFWWSHIPIAKLDGFLAMLHSKLMPGALVLFTDNLCYEYHGNRRRDEAGNLLEERVLQNGNTFEIIKNFPTESEIITTLAAHADQIVYKQFDAYRYWTVSYRTKPTHAAGRHSDLSS